MTKAYTKPSEDLDATIERVRTLYHPDLEGVTIGALFICDLDDTSAQALTHQGYPAEAVVRITPIRDRVLGVADAIITVDRAAWLSLTAMQRDALIDHELCHLERVVDKDAGVPMCDVEGRPKLTMRQHDHQVGFFGEVVQRHGDDAPEARSAHALMKSSTQMSLEFWAHRVASVTGAPASAQVN